MSRVILPAIVIALAAFATAPAAAQQYAPYGARAPQAPNGYVRTAPRSNLGGGFIEALFGNGAPRPRYEQVEEAPPAGYYQTDPNPPGSLFAPERPVRATLNPAYLPQTVDYDGKEAPGTIIVDTPRRFLFLVQENGKAKRYGIGVGRPGFTWAGMKTITRKAEWPDWTPPPEMLQRRPDLPRHMVGGPDNPLGARALYLGSSLYRIHGSNEPWTIGTAVSSGCIRMRNEDVIDLYGRVNVGTKVVVI